MRSDVSAWSGEFSAAACEAEFRESCLPESVHLARLAFLAAVVLNILFLANDWRFRGQAHFIYAISARCTIIAASLLAAAVVRRVRASGQLQVLCAAWSLPVIGASAVLVSPRTDVALFVTFILPTIYYLVLPVSFRVAVAFGLACSGAMLGVYMYPYPYSPTALGLVLGMLTINTVLALVLGQSNRLRRLEWAATRAERAVNAELAEQRAMLAGVLRAVPAPLLITSREDGAVIQVNDAALRYFGNAIADGTVQDCLDRRDLAKLALMLRLDGRISGVETRLHMANGSARDVLLSATALTVSGTKAILTVLVDITRRKAMESLLRRLASTDPLTGCANRVRFFSVATVEVQQAKGYERPLSVLMIDIDFFKRINDAYGHEVGDIALAEFARLCRTWMRRRDLVARLGGEEFGVLLPDTGALSALALAERLRAAVQALRIERIECPMTISIGISEVFPGETTVEAALARADRALYAAKMAGRNRALLWAPSVQPLAAPDAPNG